MKKIFVILFFLYCVSAQAQINTLEKLNSRIEFMLDSLHDKYDFPGFAMTIVSDTQTVFQKTYGVKRIHKPEKIDGNSEFYWASVTKVFTGAAIMQLYEQGKLELDDPVIKYYPEFKTKKGKYSSDSITIRHLLTHSSGLVKHMDNALISNPCYDLPSKEILKKMEKEELLFKPGSNYSYSNVGIVVLGVIIENITGMPYEEYMQQNIFTPLQMNHTSLFDNNNLTDTALATTHKKHGHTFVESKRIYRRAMNPGGGMRASIEDMAIWMKACMLMDFHHQTMIMKPETFGKMWRDTLRCNLTDPNAYIAGYTWDTGDYKGKHFYAKGGNLEWQSSSYIILFEESHLGIAFVTNFRMNGWDEYILKMIDAVLEYEEHKQDGL